MSSFFYAYLIEIYKSNMRSNEDSAMLDRTTTDIVIRPGIIYNVINLY